MEINFNFNARYEKLLIVNLYFAYEPFIEHLSFYELHSNFLLSC